MEVDGTEGGWKGTFPHDVDRRIIIEAVGISSFGRSNVDFADMMITMLELEHCRHPLDRKFFPIKIAERLSLVRRSWRMIVENEIYPEILLLSDYGMNELTVEMAARLRFLQVTADRFTCMKQEAVVDVIASCPKIYRIDLKNVGDGLFYPFFHDDPFLVSALNPPQHWSSVTCVNFVISIGVSSIPSLLHLVGKFENLETFGLVISHISDVAPDGEPEVTGVQMLSRLRVLHVDLRPFISYPVIDHVLVKWKTPLLEELYVHALDNQLVPINSADAPSHLKQLICYTNPVPWQKISTAIPLPITTTSILYLTTSMVVKLFSGPYRFLEKISFQSANFELQAIPCFSRNDFGALLRSLFANEAVTEPFPNPSKLDALRCGRYPWAFYLTFFIWAYARDNVKRSLVVYFPSASFEDIGKAKGELKEDGGDWLGVLKKFCDSPLEGTVVKIFDRSKGELKL